jgi:hypothetical protein
MTQLKWVNPNRIKYVLLKDYFNEQPSVVDGDWDLDIADFESFSTYKGCYEMFVDNKLWKDTFLYKSAIKLIMQGYPQWSCSTVNSFNKREHVIRRLYESIKKNGIKEQKDLPPGFFCWNPDGDFKDNICVSIGRNGALLFMNGFHRLSISKILKVPKIPVRVVRTHAVWENFYKKVCDICSINWKPCYSYHPIDHISFSSFSSDFSDKRIELIKDNINRQHKTVLDIGSLFGFFCTRLEDEGFKCTAVENSPIFIEILTKIKEAGYFNFEIFSKSIFNLDKFEFDTVLAFNIFHHFLKKEPDYRKLELLLGRLKVKEMFVQLHDINDNQMKNAYKNYNNIEFLDFICRNINLYNVTEIYQEENARKIFKIN